MLDFNLWSKARLVNWIASRCALTQSELSKLSKNKLVVIAISINTTCLTPIDFYGLNVRCGQCVNCRTSKQRLYKELVKCLKK